MQRIFNLSKWQELEDGFALNFNNPRPRVVRLEVNSANDAALYVVSDEGETRFLARVCGRDVVEFWTAGAFGLCTQETGVYVYTPDGEDWAQMNLDERVFTVIREKRARNPELELMMAVVERNVQRRAEQQFNELQALFERREAARAAQHQAAGATGAHGSEPQSDVGGSDSGNAEPAGGGDEAKARPRRRSDPSA